MTPLVISQVFRWKFAESMNTCWSRSLPSRGWFVQQSLAWRLRRLRPAGGKPDILNVWTLFSISQRGRLDKYAACWRFFSYLAQSKGVFPCAFFSDNSSGAWKWGFLDKKAESVPFNKKKLAIGCNWSKSVRLAARPWALINFLNRSCSLMKPRNRFRPSEPASEAGPLSCQHPKIRCFHLPPGALQSAACWVSSHANLLPPLLEGELHQLFPRMTQQATESCPRQSHCRCQSTQC